MKHGILEPFSGTKSSKQGKEDFSPEHFPDLLFLHHQNDSDEMTTENVQGVYSTLCQLFPNPPFQLPHPIRQKLYFPEEVEGIGFWVLPSKSKDVADLCPVSMNVSLEELRDQVSVMSTCLLLFFGVETRHFFLKNLSLCFINFYSDFGKVQKYK